MRALRQPPHARLFFFLLLQQQEIKLNLPPVLVLGKIPDLAIEQLRDSLPNGVEMGSYFEACDKKLFSTPGRPDGCQIDTYAAEYAFEVSDLKQQFERHVTFELNTCNQYYRAKTSFDTAKTDCRTASTPNLDYWPLECRMLQAELDQLYNNKTLEQNVVCDMLTKGRRDALAATPEQLHVVSCAQLAHVMATKYHPFLYRTTVEQRDHLWPQKCKARLCETQKYFYTRIRPRAVQNFTAVTTAAATTVAPAAGGASDRNGTNGTNGTSSSRQLEQVESSVDAESRRTSSSSSTSSLSAPNPTTRRVDAPAAAAQASRAAPAAYSLAPGGIQRRALVVHDDGSVPPLANPPPLRGKKAAAATAAFSSDRSEPIVSLREVADRQDDMKRHLTALGGIDVERERYVGSDGHFDFYTALVSAHRDLVRQGHYAGAFERETRIADRAEQEQSANRLEEAFATRRDQAERQKAEVRQKRRRRSLALADELVSSRASEDQDKHQQRSWTTKQFTPIVLLRKAKRRRLSKNKTPVSDSPYAESEEQARLRSLAEAAAGGDGRAVPAGRPSSLSPTLAMGFDPRSLQQQILLRQRLSTTREGSSSPELDTMSRQLATTQPEYTLWPENFYIDGCDRISYMPFDEFQCAMYLENKALCECIIPEMQNKALKNDDNCFQEWEKYLLFGRRGLAEAELSEPCRNSLWAFFGKIRNFPQCRVADLPNDDELAYIVLPTQMAATEGLDDASVVGNVQYNQLLALATQLQEDRPSCPWLQHSNKSMIMECMDFFQCHVQYDGWGCCIKAYRAAIAQPWHYLEAWHSDPSLCCPHNETIDGFGKEVTIFERPLPSPRPSGNRRCPPEAPQMCDELASGGQGDFVCRAQCARRRSCSPVIYPEPVLMVASNDTMPYPSMEYQGNGCCVYADMYEIAVTTTSKIACLFLCDIDDDCLGATVSAGSGPTPCRHHLLDALRTMKLDDFRLGCQPSLAPGTLEKSSQDCWLKKIILTASATEELEETDVYTVLLTALAATFGVAVVAGCLLLVRMYFLEKERLRRERRKQKTDPTKYEIEFAADGETRKVIEEGFMGDGAMSRVAPKTDEEKLAALTKIGKVVRAGQKVDFSADFGRIEKKPTIDAPMLDAMTGKMTATDQQAAMDAKNWREQDEARKLRRLKKRARAAGLKLGRYLSLRQLQASKGLRDPRTVRSLTMDETGDYVMGPADRAWKESGDGARYRSDGRKGMIKMGDDVDGGAADTTFGGTATGGRTLDDTMTGFTDTMLDDAGASSALDSERARQLLSGDVTAEDLFDLDESMMDDETVAARKRVMVDKFATVPDGKGEKLLDQVSNKRPHFGMPSSPKSSRAKRFPLGTDLSSQPQDFNPLSLEATDPNRSLASFSVEPRSPMRQRIKYQEDYEREAANEDYYDPIEKYPSLIISVDLFKGHGGSLGLKFEEPNSTKVIGFHDPVQKRWGWRVGDEIVAVLMSRRAGNKAWFPVENFDELYKRFSAMKETWQEFHENKRVYFGVYRANIPKGEKYPPLPKKLHMITARYLDDRGSDFDESSEDEYWQLTDDINVKKKRKVLPRADWLRYCAWKFNIEKENQAAAEYARRMQKIADIEAGEGKFFQDPANLADFTEVVNVVDEYGRSTAHTVPRGIDVHLEQGRKEQRAKEGEKRRKLKNRVKNNEQILPGTTGADYREWPDGGEKRKDITLMYTWPGEGTASMIIGEDYDVGENPLGMYEKCQADRFIDEMNYPCRLRY
eukprot:CAMPEP_0179004202 /NCGR_PEP_ID=MMETSP0795-20121207/13149_1 /TAXON_ID=88552 /ORGANISM="Amoebophrya sp., Strain Ameob2" /LENGTH=1749 /DNA_ID=CAMNT_0020698389 /DNA_START=583 /DNA_END=5833 /DNA_ORIENTATION=+